MLALLALLSTANATEVGSRPFGLGVVLGDPTGISGKYYLGGVNAIDGAIGESAFDGGVYLQGTYLWHPSVLADPGPFEMPWHVGIGGFLGDGHGGRGDWRGNDGLYAGARAPIGLDLDFHGAPVQVFGDIALRMLLVPGIDIDFDVSLGVRYYF